MKLITFNINGLASVLKKGILNWIQAVDADIICLQEVKIHPGEKEKAALESLGYHCHFFNAEKKGYSGVAILSKTKPDRVEIGVGNEEFDREGRVIRADFGDITVVSAYFPSGTTGDLRQEVKYRFLDFMLPWMLELRKSRPKLIVSGDYNICHKEIDIHNPKSNAKSSGFLPDERAWMDKLVEAGFVDSFRLVDPRPHQYTWWSLRFNVRERNLGWRIDYNFITPELVSSVKRSVILSEAHFSDHAPVMLELE